MEGDAFLRLTNFCACGGNLGLVKKSKISKKHLPQVSI
jgi:hypothetical protein